MVNYKKHSSDDENKCLLLNLRVFIFIFTFFWGEVKIRLTVSYFFLFFLEFSHFNSCVKLLFRLASKINVWRC